MTSNLIKNFGKNALIIFKKALTPYGFKRESKKTDQYFCDIVFVNDERYIKVEANIHPRDYPPYFNIVLGEGPRDFIESDWNSVALWRLKNMITDTDSGREYSLEGVMDLPGLLEKSKDEMLKYGEKFLSGDTDIFHQARKAQNKDREPYKVYSPDENGNYSVSNEPESVKIKKKYT
jgi:hypothetical protein